MKPALGHLLDPVELPGAAQFFGQVDFGRVGQVRSFRFARVAFFPVASWSSNALPAGGHIEDAPHEPLRERLSDRVQFGDALTAIWLESWQVLESHLKIAVGDRVEWNLTPTNSAWMHRLFGDRRQIRFAFDAYSEDAYFALAGTVAALNSVYCEWRREKGGDMVPLANSATETIATSTHDFLGTVQPETLCGFIVEVTPDDSPSCKAQEEGTSVAHTRAS